MKLKRLGFNTFIKYNLVVYILLTMSLTGCYTDDITGLWYIEEFSCKVCADTVVYRGSTMGLDNERISSLPTADKNKPFEVVNYEVLKDNYLLFSCDEDSIYNGLFKYELEDGETGLIITINSPSLFIKAELQRMTLEKPYIKFPKTVKTW